MRSTAAFRLTLQYMILAGLWILVADRILFNTAIDAAILSKWQTYKGWVFVFVTGCIVYFIIQATFANRLKTERNLVLANEKLRALIAASPLAILTLDAENRVMSWNSAAEQMFGWTEKEVLGCVNPAVTREQHLEIRSYLKLAAAGKLNKVIETKLQKKDGSLLEAGLSLAPIRNDKGENSGIVAMIADITDQKERERQLQYLSLHDALTDIYNRAYFEHEMHRLDNSRCNSVGMIICDLDGLKLYNDSLGHAVGDTMLKAAAHNIRSCFRESDVVARIGGDEFAVLLPEAGIVAVENACERIRKTFREHNHKHQEYYLSVSVGYAVGAPEKTKMAELFKEADNNMYTEKVRRGETVRETTLQILIRALNVRDFVAQGHTDRLEELAAGLAGQKGIDGEHLTYIRMFAKFHDIGKVGVPMDVLQKAGPLTPKEIEMIRKHPEIGHRIALAAPDIFHLADWILKHHEWWNGSGYPLGLKGKDIPIECRILAIVDAYDALTNDRPYRSARAPETALAELRTHAGSQFDPELVDTFIEMIRKRDHQKIPLEG